MDLWFFHLDWFWFGLWLLWNCFTFAVYAYDKSAAKRKAQGARVRRIPEVHLHLLGLLGGWLGALLAMRLLRHKTQSTQFQWLWGGSLLGNLALLSLFLDPF
jgi:uncharacterized membrane protein YsdA (DUF1294 family)